MSDTKKKKRRGRCVKSPIAERKAKECAAIMVGMSVMGAAEITSIEEAIRIVQELASKPKRLRLLLEHSHKVCEENMADGIAIAEGTDE